MRIFKLDWASGQQIVSSRDYVQLLQRDAGDTGWLLTEHTKDVLYRKGVFRRAGNARWGRV